MTAYAVRRLLLNPDGDGICRDIEDHLEESVRDGWKLVSFSMDGLFAVIVMSLVTEE